MPSGRKHDSRVGKDRIWQPHPDGTKRMHRIDRMMVSFLRFIGIGLFLCLVASCSRLGCESGGGDGHVDSSIVPDGREDPKLRTRNEKIVTTKDGRQVRVVSITPFHYKDEDGDLQDIDTSLKETSRAYENESNTIKTQIAKEFRQGVQVQKGDIALRWLPALVGVRDGDRFAPLFSFKPDGVRHEPGSNSVRFESSRSDWAEEYVVQAGALEHLLHIGSKPYQPREMDPAGSQLVLTGTIQIEPGARLRKKVEGENTDRLVIQNTSSEDELLLQKPVLIDAAGEATVGSYAWLQHENAFEIRLPMAWLADPSRVYPVTVDPTIFDTAFDQQHFTMYGAASFDRLGTTQMDLSSESVQQLVQAGGVTTGDLNGDGIDDLVVNGPGRTNTSNKVYIMFGNEQFGGTVDLASQMADIRISGLGGGQVLDFIQANALTVGDLNSDGVADLVIAAAEAHNGSILRAGAVYVFFGGAALSARCGGAFPCDIVLSTTNQADITFFGRDTLDRMGGEVATGDLNGDGAPDLAIESIFGNGPSNSRGTAGEIYLVFGGAALAGRCGNNYPCRVDFAATNPDITIYGANVDDEAVQGFLPVQEGVPTQRLNIGDLDGDGSADLVLGFPGADGVGTSDQDAGRLYILFAGAKLPSPIPAIVDLSAPPVNLVLTTVFGDKTIAPAGGLTLFGAVGDLDGDSKDELLFSGYNRKVLLLFGRDPWPSSIDLGVTGPDLTIAGMEARRLAVGRINNDLVGDLMIGVANGNGPDTRGVAAGEVHVMYGRTFTETSIDLTANPADVIIYGANGGDQAGFSVGSVDLNKDGFADIVVGAPFADGPANDRLEAGEVYVVLGNSTPAGGQEPLPQFVSTELPGLKFRVEITNFGTITTTYSTNFALTRDTSPVASIDKDITLAPNETHAELVDLVANFSGSGTYTLVTTAVLPDLREAKSSISKAIAVSGAVTANVNEVLEGDFALPVTVKNTGQLDTSYTVKYVAGTQLVTRSYGPLAPQATVTDSVSFSNVPGGTPLTAEITFQDGSSARTLTQTLAVHVIDITLQIVVATLDPQTFRINLAASTGRYEFQIRKELFKDNTLISDTTEPFQSTALVSDFSIGSFVATHGSGTYRLRVSSQFPIGESASHEASTTLVLEVDIAYTGPVEVPEGDVSIPYTITKSAGLPVAVNVLVTLDGEPIRLPPLGLPLIKHHDLGAEVTQFQDSVTFTRQFPGSRSGNLRLTFHDGAATRTVQRDFAVTVRDVNLKISVHGLETNIFGSLGGGPGFLISLANIGEIGAFFPVTFVITHDGEEISRSSQNIFVATNGTEQVRIAVPAGAISQPGVVVMTATSNFPIDSTATATGSLELAARITVSINPDSASVFPGSNIEITATITNEGNIPVTFTVEDLLYQPPMTVVPGSKKILQNGGRVTYTHVMGNEELRGQIRVTYPALAGTGVVDPATGQEVIEIAKQYHFTVARSGFEVMIEPTPPYVQESDATVPVKIRNTGTSATSVNLIFRVRKTSESFSTGSEIVKVTIQAGDTFEKVFNWGRLEGSFSNPIGYTMTAESLVGTGAAIATATFSVGSNFNPDANGDRYTDKESLRAGLPPAGTRSPTPTAFGPQDYNLGHNSVAAARRTGDPVDVATGNLFYARTDLTINAPIHPLQLTRVYNSQLSSVGMFGKGWTSNFENRLVMEWDLALVEQKDFGSLFRHLHVKNSPALVTPDFDDDPLIDYPLDQGRYVASHSSITDQAIRVDKDHYEVRTKRGVRRIYNGYLRSWESPPNALRGTLQAIEDTNGNRLELIHDPSGHLTEARNPGGDGLRFFFSGNLVTAVCDHGGRCLRYLYDTASRLIRVTDPAGQDLSYAYNSDDNLIEIQTKTGQVYKYEYDAEDRCIATIETRGFKTAYTYRPFAGLTTVVNPDGSNRRYLYDEMGAVLAEYDELNQTSVISLDAGFNQTSVMFPDGSLVSSILDYRGNLIAMSDQLGRTTTVDYSHPLSRPTKVIDPAGAVTTLEYDPAGNLMKTTDPTGAVAAYSYDGRGQVTTLTDPRGHVTTFSYDAKLRIIEARDPLGSTSRLTYDLLGRVVQVTDPLGRLASLVYDVLDNLVSVTDPLGRSTAFTYDANGQIASVRKAGGGTTHLTYANADYRDLIAKITNAIGASYSFGYDTGGNLTTITDPAGQTTVLAYDALRRVVKITDPLGNTRTRSYDAAGNLVELLDAKGNKTKYFLDVARQLTSVTDALNQVTEYTYDLRGNLSSVRNPRGAVRSFQYDLLGRLVAATDALGLKTILQYDPAGNLTGITMPDNKTTTLTYDALNRLTKKTFPDGAITTYSFDPNGNLTRAANAVKAEQFFFDAAKQITKVLDEKSGESIEYTYDADGNRASLKVVSTGGTRTALYAYDAADRLTKMVDPEGRAYDLKYDLRDRLTQIAYPNGFVQNRFHDLPGRLASIENARNGLKYNAFNYDYDQENNITRITEIDAGLQSVGITQASYDALDRITRVDYPKAQWLSLWTQDINLVIQKVLDKVPDDLLEQWEKGQIDKLDLIKDKAGFDLKDLPTPTLPEFVTYTYDPAGNRSQMIRTTSQALNLIETHAYTHNSADELTTLLMKGNNKDLKFDFTYDVRGNLTKKAVTDNTAFWENFTVDYAYDFENRLTQVKSTKWGLAGLSPHVITYRYDALGRRVERNEGVGTILGNAYWERSDYTYDGLDPVRIDQEYFGDLFSFFGLTNPARKSTWYNRAGDLLVSQQDLAPFSGGSVDWLGLGFENHALRHAEFVHPDHLASTTMLTNWKGQVKNQYRYDVFGEPIFQRPYGLRHQSNFLFNAQEWDNDARLIHFYARDYDPAISRFLGRDPIIGITNRPETWNAYSYALNNALNLIDLLGFRFHKKAWKWTKEHVGGIVGAGVGGFFGGLAGISGGPLGVAAGVVVGGKIGYDTGQSIQNFVTGKSDSICASVSAGGNTPESVSVKSAGVGECPGPLTVRSSGEGNPLQPPPPKDPLTDAQKLVIEQFVEQVYVPILKSAIPDFKEFVCDVFPGILCSLVKIVPDPPPTLAGKDPSKNLGTQAPSRSTK